MARSDKARRRVWRFKLDDSTILEVSAPRGATEKQVRRRGRVSLVLGTVLAMLTVTALAIAGHTVNPTSLTFNAVEGGANPPTQTFTFSGPATCTGGTISDNATWLTLDKSVVADDDSVTGGVQTTVTATVDVTGLTASGSPYSGTVTINPTDSQPGANEPCDSNLTVAVTLNVAAGDTTDPDSASVVINDGDAWTNTGSVTLDISAHDAVGIARYRLAETQAGLDSAPDVAVSLAEMNFSRGDLAFTLGAGDAAATAAWARFCDAADNCTDGSDTIGLDTVKPVITGSAGAYVQGTWTNQDVVVSFTCADDQGAANSGVATDTVAGETATTSGAGQSITNTGECVDNAGNVADAATVGDIDIDKIAPTVTCVAASFVLNEPGASVSANVTDQALLSGPAQSPVSAAADTSSVGSKTVSLTGYDNAGNGTTVACAYTVGYNFAGLFAPIDKPNTMNVSKAGQAIPLKWRLTDYFGDPVLGLTSVTVSVTSVSCSYGTGTPDALEEYASGASGLQSLGDGYYQFNWKTPTSYAGSCKSLNLNLGEGAARMGLALISFKK